MTTTFHQQLTVNSPGGFTSTTGTVLYVRLSLLGTLLVEAPRPGWGQNQSLRLTTYRNKENLGWREDEGTVGGRREGVAEGSGVVSDGRCAEVECLANVLMTADCSQMIGD